MGDKDMKLKITSVMIIISLVMISSLGVGITAKEDITIKNEEDNFLKCDFETDIETLNLGQEGISVRTTGPIAPILDIADITFIVIFV